MIAVILPLQRSDLDVAARLAEDFSPRIECGASGVALDASGLTRLFGSPDGLAREIARQAEARGLHASIGIAATRAAAALAAATGKIQPGRISVIPPGEEARALAPLPLEALLAIHDLIGPALEKASQTPSKRRKKGQGRNYRLAPGPDQQLTSSPDPKFTSSPDLQIDRLRRWGLKTLGDFAALPAADVAARLGAAGPILQRAARGEDERPLVPPAAAPSFLQSMRLEWPVDDLQPLAFIVSRLCESLEQALAAADRGAISLTTMLRLVTKQAYARTLALPAPMRDARVLRTLVMLDLESHPPQAAIDEVVIDVDVAPGRILQTGLFEPALPAPEALSTLIARLGAVVGESRVGAPAIVDTHRPGAFAMKPFAPHQAPDSRLQAPAGSSLESGVRSPEPVSVIRRFRPPRAARVRVEQARPVHLEAEDIRGEIVMAAGPWRSSGAWWRAGAADASAGWDHDEWDVSLDTGIVCRVAQDRVTKAWVVEGVLD